MLGETLHGKGKDKVFNCAGRFLKLKKVASVDSNLPKKDSAFSRLGHKSPWPNSSLQKPAYSISLQAVNFEKGYNKAGPGILGPYPPAFLVHASGVHNASYQGPSPSLPSQLSKKAPCFDSRPRPSSTPVPASQSVRERYLANKSTASQPESSRVDLGVD